MNAVEMLPWWGLAWCGVVFAVAGFCHGVIGFGFPLVAMPLLAMVIDYKAAVLFCLVPVFALNIGSVVVGGGLRESIGRFWSMALGALIGVYLGTLALIHVDPAPFLLTLVIALLLYLNMERFGKSDVPFVRRHAAPIGFVVSLVAGWFEATVNVAVPPLLIYFMLLDLSPRAIVQALNLCFIGGKVVQIATWSVDGGIPVLFWLRTTPWALLALGTFAIGARVRSRVSPATYVRWLRGFLWIMCGVLLLQFIKLVGAL